MARTDALFSPKPVLYTDQIKRCDEIGEVCLYEGLYM